MSNDNLKFVNEMNHIYKQVKKYGIELSESTPTEQIFDCFDTRYTFHFVQTYDSYSMVDVTFKKL